MPLAVIRRHASASELSRVVPRHGQHVSGLIAAWAVRTTQFASGVEPTIANFAGPNWEIYGHWQSEWNTNPSQIRTDVYYLLTF